MKKFLSVLAAASAAISFSAQAADYDTSLDVPAAGGGQAVGLPRRGSCPGAEPMP